MIDALLAATLATLRSAGLGYDEATSEITPGPQPPARAGTFFCALHQLEDVATGDNRLEEDYSWGLALTARITVPPDRVGNALLVSELARRRGPLGQPSFNARADDLRALFHMDWATLGAANTLLAAWTQDVVVYGFCEPARYRGGGKAVRLVGPEWFGARAAEEGPPVALTATLRFEGAKRFQPLATFV